MNQTKVDKLLLKLVENRLSEQETEALSEWLKSEENQNYFHEYVKINHLLNSEQHFGNADRLLDTIKPSKKRFNATVVLKYAAVLLVLIGSTLFFKNVLFSTQDSVPPAPVVRNNQIRPGVNSAVLTLGDGKEVALGKGADYTTETLNAKEDKIVYVPKQGKTSQMEYNYLSVPRGGQFSLLLSDSTKVWLNSESKLKYPVDFVPGQSREVYLLYGEAYFEVASSERNHGDDFKVYHNEQEVRVLGTEFNVKAYGNEPEVLTTLVEGKVTVRNGDQSFKINPGQQSRLDLESGKMHVSEVDVFSETSWKSGVFSFKKKRLKEIMRTLSRWYDMEVIFENKSLEEKRFKGVLRKNQSIEDVLSVIMSSSLNSYEINDKTVILK
ncbi:FecR family protein [Flagellimonas oceanensis]|uniref:FecR family protein n=1 Tax=Flagellimonas oceanensis TaxID=2499163 RepID=UPI003BAD62AA|tara:strand:- start:190 stop:1335 length:1146 start_codon:yes stop_codon:yes gene_type:complete